MFVQLHINDFCNNQINYSINQSIEKKRNNLISFKTNNFTMCSNFALKLRPDHKINQKLQAWRNIGTLGICPHLLLGDTFKPYSNQGGRLYPLWFENVPPGLNLKKIKALISFDRRLILKTFSAELHKATTELLGYQWLIIYMLSLGLVLSTKILKNDSKLEYFGKISPKRPISGQNRNFEFL